MHKIGGAEVEHVEPGSPAHTAGIAPGDVILSINDHTVSDAIDFMFCVNEDELSVVTQRKSRKFSYRIPLKEGQNIGIGIKSFRIRTCTNKCIFCFVSQLPRGLRRSLYVKDEDYRMSFLYGNYITLTNLSARDRKRIVQQKLSPLYISVHSTDRTLRNTLLGNQKAADILKELRYFKDNKIRMHCQIVLCPWYNDGEELKKTIRDLYRLYPFVMSVAVVPVGLTAHRKTGPSLKAVEKSDALRALEVIDSFQRRFKKKHGDPIVYGSDELYIKAEAEFPPLSEYGELPQIENGVGMVPSFMQQAKRIKIPQMQGKRRCITFTGISFFPFLARFIDRLKRSGIDVEAVPVENTFFGRSVTVAGLLTGRDVARTLSEVVRKDDLVLIPDIVMKEGEKVFLDDVSVQDIERVLGTTVKLIESTPRGLIDALATLP